MRRFGDPRKQSVKYTRRPGAYAVIVQGKDLLLTLQDAEERELQLPGGGIDPGESAVRALHREVFEETGYRITNIRRLGAYQRYTFMPEYNLWAHKICHIFLCNPARRIGPPTELEHSVVWMSAKDASSTLANQGDCAFVKRHLNFSA
jgi:8-oxo-dGTP diphosphatase